MQIHRTFALGVLLSLAACGGGAAHYESTEPPTAASRSQALEALVPIQGCAEVENYLRDRMIAKMNRGIDRQIEEVRKRTRGSCSWGSPADYDDRADTWHNSSSGSVTNASTAATSSGATSSSTTNNQVAGVDEADFIKNDDTYLYVAVNGAFRIVQAWPPETATQVAKVPLEGEPRKLFVEGDRALVYVAVPRTGAYSMSGGAECTYGYDCVPSGDGSKTRLLVFDIANRSAPVKIRDVELSGSLLAARRIGDAVHTVVAQSPRDVDGLALYPDMTASPCDSNADPETQKASVIAGWEAARRSNLEKIASADVLETLPSVKEDGQRVSALACEGYYRPGIPDGRTFTSLVSLEIAAPAGAGVTTSTIVSDPGVVYASATGLYMSVPHTRAAGEGWYAEMEGETQASTVHEFRIGDVPSLTRYEASGLVKGRVLNPFALDEHDAHLRIATTTGHVPDPDTHSTMSILEKKQDKLVLTGKVDHIAKTEDIRSVRFDGSRGYVVTFKKTDPLYVFDLGDPAAPTIAGELEIPGFSTYMHRMDEQHLLTIGYDADDQGDFALFQGVMLQIFDVSDMQAPTLVHKEVIGTRGSSSEALTNHLAFNYYPEKDLLAFPMTICEAAAEVEHAPDMTFSGLLVYDVTAARGFTRRGQVAHPSASSGAGYDAKGCDSWWTRASSEVKRSVIMDSVVYSVSERRVKVNHLTNLASDVAVVSLEP